MGNFCCDLHCDFRRYERVNLLQIFAVASVIKVKDIRRQSTSLHPSEVESHNKNCPCKLALQNLRLDHVYSFFSLLAISYDY